jgi:hypothetical protein
MISPSPTEFRLFGRKVVSGRILGPARVPISYRQSLSPAIRVFLISFFGIPYFPKNIGKHMEYRENNVPLCRRPGARN